ncbi:hypothetical protein GCM10010172_15930 [Paractinoplanes ferrugineus]|uniref:Uncharacterized protein n=1 Tax=Paractinoplanes ferrugineus TaxID=113564 RepID=A0A919MJH2_9ACTN|nr:hypothetical protein Afe05nite_19970 [Actinoplanes ferrugineus]
MLAEDASGERADGEGERADAAPDADRRGPLPRVREELGDQSQGGRGEQGGTDTLYGPHADQHLLAVGQTGADRGQGENGQAAEEHPAGAEHIGDPAAGEQQAGEDEDVRAGDPLQTGDAQPEVALDRREGHVDHVVVEVGHEGAERHRDERPPFSVHVDLLLEELTSYMYDVHVPRI